MRSRRQSMSKKILGDNTEIEAMFLGLMELLSQQQSLIGEASSLLLEQKDQSESILGEHKLLSQQLNETKIELEKWKELSQTLNAENSSLLRQNQELLRLANQSGR